MKSVLVDFYNLHLRSGFIEEPTDEQLRNGQIFTTPDEDERQRIISFFEIYAPNVLRKLTSEEKRQIRDFEAKIYESQKEDVFQVILENKKVFFDNYTTLEGYEIRNEVPWFDSIFHFSGFVKEYWYFNLIINKSINGNITGGDFKLLEVTKHTYIVEVFDMEIMMGDREDLILEVERDSQHFRLGIYFGELFPSIYEEAMSVLKKGLTLRRCQAPKTQKSSACKNIFIPYEKGKEQLYCSKKCANRARRREYYLKKGK